MKNQDNSSQKIMRFRKSERNIHWAMAIPFMLCLVTALIRVYFFNPDPTRPYLEIISWIHRISGVAFIIFPLIEAIKSRNDIRIYIQDIKQVWVWTFEDVKWLCLIGLSAISKKISLPDQGKFNAAEKLNFMLITISYPLYIVTGIVIWMTKGILLSWMIHFGLAVLAIPFVSGHLYMAMVNPSTRKAFSGMTSGFVDREFVKHHHTLWYRENFEYALATSESIEPAPAEAGLRDDQVIEPFEKPVPSA